MSLRSACKWQQTVFNSSNWMLEFMGRAVHGLRGDSSVCKDSSDCSFGFAGRRVETQNSVQQQ
jgi:hypothetical protein